VLGEGDLSLFFNPDEHAVAATFKTPGGVLVRTANVIFNEPIQEMRVGQEAVDQLQPSFLCPIADLAGVAKGYTVEIEGRGTYRVVRQLSDGTGVSTVYVTRS
jgi:hypothetical protein